MTNSESELAAAIKVFVHAFCHTKSATYPYVPTLVDGLWVMRDTPDRKKARKIEIVAHGKPPEEVVGLIAAAGIDWHFLCDIQLSETGFEDLRAEYKRLGYRALSTEWMFVHDLKQIPSRTSDPPVRVVRTQEEADAIPQLAQHKLKMLPGTRDFRIWDEVQDFGWVRSVDVESSAWVSGLFVREQHRRRGLGAALMSALLQSDVDHGRDKSILLASNAGAKLYPTLGYRQIGILQMFCPVR